MTTNKSSSTLQNVSSAVPIILLVGSIIIGYANLHTDLSLLRKSQEQTGITLKALDKYDRYLQHQSEGIERRLLVVETKQKDIRDTQVRLETKLDRILVELVSLGTSITELKTINAQEK
ncbi:MAG: hypothetical protein HRU12_10125 [Phaeodactylibacter sp.]|nr:hypothetical protein [Phaeodactylibacter sp.]